MRIFEDGITWRTELLDEIENILGNSLQAVTLIEHLCWDEIVAPSYQALKQLIIKNPTRKVNHKVDPAYQEHFLVVFGIFWMQNAVTVSF